MRARADAQTRGKLSTRREVFDREGGVSRDGPPEGRMGTETVRDRDEAFSKGGSRSRVEWTPKNAKRIDSARAAS